MFEGPDARHPSQPLREAAQRLDAATVAAWKDRLTSALEAPSGLDDSGRVDAIRALEELVCAATAAQAVLEVELDASQRADQAAAGVVSARRGRGVAAQVALARRESHHRGQQHLGLAKVVVRELPNTWSAWRAGAITEWKATLIARETACLSLEDRAAVDAAVAGDAQRVERMGDRELIAACQRESYRLDAESFVNRRRKAERERHVSLRPAPDCMTWLTALLPVKDGSVATVAALTRVADTARAAGDPRTKGQVMADSLVDAVVGASATAGQTASGGRGVHLNLVMTDLALFGTSDEPAHLDGFGPVPAELAREIIAGACTTREEVWLRRLYCGPGSGDLVATGARARLFPPGLARFIRLRDRTCRTPWCDAPIRHTDHAVGYDAGGATSLDNGQGLCQACNHAKQAAGWRARPSPATGGHRIETTTPTGHTYRSGAPAVATISATPIRLDYVLAG